MSIENDRFMLCGSPEMIREHRQLLAEGGYVEGNHRRTGPLRHRKGFCRKMTSTPRGAPNDDWELAVRLGAPVPKSATVHGALPIGYRRPIGRRGTRTGWIGRLARRIAPPGSRVGRPRG